MELWRRQSDDRLRHQVSGSHQAFYRSHSGVFHKAFLKVKFYCVVPEKLFFIDNEQGFGKRQELLLDR